MPTSLKIIRRGREFLRELIHTTIGFRSLGKAVKKSSKSLHRMLGPKGNPSTGNVFASAMLSVLQKQIHVHLTVKASKIRTYSSTSCGHMRKAPSGHDHRF